LPIALEVVEQRCGEAVSTLLGRIPGDAGQVVGKAVVRCRDLQGIGMEIPEVQRGALELDGLLQMKTFVLQISAGTVDGCKLGNVPGGGDDVLAAPQ
jgi:hypothetical protein